MLYRKKLKEFKVLLQYCKMQLPSQRLKKKVEKENLWLFILSSLGKNKLSAAEIKRLITKKFGLITGNVTVYKVLYLLEIGGYVKAGKQNTSVIYSITSKGRREMKIARQFLLHTAKSIKTKFK